MRLLTHNFLQSTVKGTTKGYPLRIRPEEVVIETQDADIELARRLIPKLDLDALRSALNDLKGSSSVDIPELPDNVESHLDVLHHVLMNIHIKNGILVCPDSQREFTIKDGIPNMILHEDEI